MAPVSQLTDEAIRGIVELGVKAKGWSIAMESKSLPDLSFRDYVLNRNVAFTPTGYFIEAAKSDSDFLAVTSAEQLEQYLATKQLPASSREHARTVWHTYLNAVNRLQAKRDSLF
jgi:hypothetical protein